MEQTKEELINELIHNKLHVAVAEDIIRSNNTGKLWVGDDLLDESSVEALRQEVNFLRKTRIWRILNETIKFDAQRRMFEQSTCWEDVMFGKAVIYTLDLIDKIFISIEKTK